MTIRAERLAEVVAEHAHDFDKPVNIPLYRLEEVQNIARQIREGETQEERGEAFNRLLGSLSNCKEFDISTDLGGRGYGRLSLKKYGKILPGVNTDKQILKVARNKDLLTRYEAFKLLENEL